MRNRIALRPNRSGARLMKPSGVSVPWGSQDPKSTSLRVLFPESLNRLVVTGFFVIGLFPSVVLASSNLDFERDVAPILINHCIECHHRGKTSGQLNLSFEEGVRNGGESGPSVEIGHPDKSPLIQRIEAGEMPPPEKEKSPLTKEEIATLRSWISGGASWPQGRELGLHEQTVNTDQARQFWAYQPVRRPAIPASAGSHQNSNPIDAFIEEKLNEAGIQRSDRATVRQLLRRASLDLTGMPPSLEDQSKFASEESSVAYEAMVDELLAHRGYGERWARYWLDLVRYADSNGYERDQGKPSVWRYRDYVIDAFNQDKPYDRFVMEQLAGDELPDRGLETIIATGFHALGSWQDEVDPLEQPQYRADELDDMLRTTSQTFLAVTIGCARCHNHKFDPISMVDYYSLSAILSPLKRPNAGREDRDLPAGTLAQRQAIEARDQKIQEWNRQKEQMRLANESEWADSGKSQLSGEVIAALRKPAHERSPQQRELAAANLKVWQDELAVAMTEERRQKSREIDSSIETLRHATPDLPRAYFLFEDTISPPKSFLLLSGRASNPGPEMHPAVPVVLTRTQPDIQPTEQSTTGRRLAFAKWIVDPANPLTSRVIVNRVWQHHFGTGLVATPSDFGKIGARPTHPELLDWLADWFVHDANWSLKKLHRLIMTSRTYQASCQSNETQRSRDLENRLLGHYPNRRLDVEAIRDSILAVSGKLNPEMYGPAVRFPIPASVIEAHTDKEASWTNATGPAIYRRTIYGYVKRTLLVPMLEVMDLCDTTNSTDKRSITSIAPQALTLYNGDFVNEQAAYFADRILREAGSDRLSQVDRAYRIALSRPPTADEAATLTQFLKEESANPENQSKPDPDRLALTQLCRVLLNLNEFVYIE